MIKTRPGFRNSGRIAKHGNTAVNCGKLAAGDANWPAWMSDLYFSEEQSNSLGVVDAELEASGAPFN